MSFNLSALSIACFSAFTIASCNVVGGSSGGTQVKNPTVDEMMEMERQWGVTPQTSRPRQTLPSISSGASVPAPSPAPSPTPTPVLAPEPVPLPETQTAVPPVFEPPAGATPDQIKKLKN